MAKTVADLIWDLKGLNPDYIVGISSDEEGNDIREWSGDYSFCLYENDEFRGYVYDADDNETVVAGDDANSIVLWP